MAQIIAPNKDYTGVSASVTFVKGVGETSDAYLIEWFKEHGYTVVDSKPPEVPSVEPEAEAVDADERVEEAPEKPKRTRSSRAKAADEE